MLEIVALQDGTLAGNDVLRDAREKKTPITMTKIRAIGLGFAGMGNLRSNVMC